ncbi:cytochrome P450 [Gordonia sp. 135]|nr:cytochrome P450 [Gordonia sp. 135]
MSMSENATAATTAAGTVPPERVEVPPHVPEELVHWVDHHNDEIVHIDPIGLMDELREKYRVFYSPAYEGFWAVTRWEDQREVFQRPEDFSSSPVGLPGGPGYGGVKMLPIELDPPEHKKYRALINPVFGPKRIGAMEDHIRSTANALIDDILENNGDKIEFMEAYAEQLPVRIFTEMLGLPFEEHKKFIGWVSAILHSSQIGDGLVRKREAGGEVTKYLTQLIGERAADIDSGVENDDLITILLNSEVDGEKLTHDEVLRMSFLLFIAGLDTVTAAHGLMFRFLADNPEHRAQIVSDPEFIPNAIEELLRYNSFVNDARTVTHDLEFAGVAMKKGDRVWLHSGSACRDPREFDDPLIVDFLRRPNRHLAFAAGAHRCAGSNLARLELRISFEEWHRRIPDYQVTPGTELRMHCGGVAGLESLPLTLG